jgi:spermidine/putrescine transport system substrate-binding protein
VGHELKTIDDLWAPELKGKIVVLSEMRDTVGVIMLSQGKDISSDFSEDDFMSALDVLQKQVDSGQIRQVKGNSYLEDLYSGNAIAAIGWSGDMLVAQAEQEDPNYTFALPETGGTLWSDNLMIPIGSPHKANAEKLIDYYYDPAVAAEVAAYVQYICPVEGAKEEMQKIDPSLVDSPLIFPTEEDLAKVKVFRSLTPDEETKFAEEFQKVIGN